MLINKGKAAGIAILLFGTGSALMAYQGMQAPTGAKPGHVPPVVPPLAKPSTVDATDWLAGWPELTKAAPSHPRTKAMLESLEEPISMNFPNATPLRDVLGYIKKATVRADLPKGLIIYVSPEGLQDADKTITSTVTMESEDLPLGMTLRLLLKQLSLTYELDAKYGLLIVTSTSSTGEETPLSIMQDKAIRGELTREQYKQLIEAMKLRNEVEKLNGLRDADEAAQARAQSWTIKIEKQSPSPTNLGGFR